MVRAVLGLLALAAALVGPLIYAGPQLASDVAVGERWTLADDLAIKGSKCTRWYLLVSTCQVDYVSRRDPAQLGGTLTYLVFGSWAGERTRLLRSPADPSWVGTTVGQQHMQQRLVSLGAFLLLALAFAVGLVRFLIKAARSGEPDIVRAPSPGPAIPAGRVAFGRRATGSAG